MMQKRAISFVLLLALLLTLPVYAADEGALFAEPVAAQAGEQVRIDLKLQNPGLIGMRIFASYDGSLLRLDKVENGVIFEDNHATFNRDITANPYTMLWDDSLRKDNIMTNGTLCTLTFTILPETEPQETRVKIDVDANSTFQNFGDNFDLVRVPVAGTECAVTILPEEEPPVVVPPTIAIRDYTAIKTIQYGESIQFTADVLNPIPGGQICWYIDGEDRGTGASYFVKEATTNFTVQAKYVKDNTVYAESETETVKVVPVLQIIAIKAMPAKTAYKVGESFDQTGLTLKATFSDGSTQTVTSGFVCTGFDSAAPGTKTITVTYEGKTATFTVTVRKEEPAPGPSIAIRDYTQERTVDYRTTITFTAEVENPVAGAQVYWFIDNKDAGTCGITYTAAEARQTFTVQARYMQGSTVLAKTETETVKVKTDFISKLIAFFRGLFGRLPKIAQAYLGFEPGVNP